MSQHSLVKKRGFTLLEILLVIAAIGILAAIVIVAINPQRQLAQVRDTERSSDLNTLQRALDQYLIDNGTYPDGLLSRQYQVICNTQSNNSGAGSIGSDCYDLRSLVPTYIPSIPNDDNAVSETGYFVSLHPENERVSLYAPQGELDSPVSLNQYSWTPQNLEGLELWLDASDESTITFDGGNSVSAWEDKSPTGRTVTQTSASRQPSWVEGEMIFSGSQRFNTNLGVNQSKLNQGMTLAKVMQIEANSTSHLTGALSPQRLYVGYRSSDTMAFGYGNLNTHNIAINNALENNIYLLTQRNDRILNFLNGTQGGNNSVTAGGGSSTFFIGDLGEGIHYVTGRINEVVVTDTTMPIEEQQLLEGYLAHKWDNVDSLPNGHPYKDIELADIFFELGE